MLYYLSKEALDTLLQKEQENGFTISRDAVQLINTRLNAKIALPVEEGETKMCKAIDDMIADGVALGKAEEKTEAYVSLVEDGLLDMITAAERLGKTVEELEKLLQEN